MIKRIIIAGCRHYDNYDEAKKWIDYYIKNIRRKYELIFISGGSTGADTLGEKYANENDYRIERYPAEWEKYGRAAGPIRNKQMAQNSDYVICFWDGKSRGTYSMITLAKKYNKNIRIKMINTY